MAKGARASSKKANRTKLRANVFGPVEQARAERLHAKLNPKQPAAVEPHYVAATISAVRKDSALRKIKQMKADLMRLGASGEIDAVAALSAKLQTYQAYADQLKTRYGV